MDKYLDYEYIDENERAKNKSLIKKIKNIFPKSTSRVQNHTNTKINDDIYKETLLNVGRYMNKSNEDISVRIEELEKEWDVERILETNAASVILSGIVLGSTVNKKWYVLSGVAAAFLLQHALQGWCPPVPIIRKMRVRTPSEIHEEISCLKYLRGDFEHF